MILQAIKGYSLLKEKYGIEVHEAESYYLTDEKTQKFMQKNTFDIQISMGWRDLFSECPGSL